jgi:hypothetical protein
MTDISFTINISTLILGLLFGGCLFLIGYFIGKQSANGVYNTAINKPNNFFDNIKKANKNNLEINDTKFVTEIKTDGMEKKYEALGETKQSTENITESISKLKNLKR